MHRQLRDVQHQLNNALEEGNSLFWLLKYCPDDRRHEAVADVERRRAEKAAERREREAAASRSEFANLTGEVKQVQQQLRSAHSVAAEG